MVRVVVLAVVVWALITFAPQVQGLCAQIVSLVREFDQVSLVQPNNAAGDLLHDDGVAVARDIAHSLGGLAAETLKFEHVGASISMAVIGSAILEPNLPAVHRADRGGAG